MIYTVKAFDKSQNIPPTQNIPVILFTRYYLDNGGLL
jgi:hypothetical protein